MIDSASPMEIPKGRKIRNCDAVAVPVYNVESSLLAAVFRLRRPAKKPAVSTLPVLSSAYLQTLALDHRKLSLGAPTLQRERDSSTRSEGIDLTAEELDLIHCAGNDSDSDRSFVHSDDSDDNTSFQGPFIEANGSAYHALALAHMEGGVGLGISRAFRSAQECKGRHAVLLLSADRFSACFFGLDGRVEDHKVCKRYVVRGKQGGAQSSHDNGKGKANSIGSCMRREGEKKLAEDVQTLMLKWKDRLRDCDVILVSCPPTKRSVLFTDVLARTDARVRKIPFCGIGKPGLEACLQAHSLVCSALFFRSWPRSVNVNDISSFLDTSAEADRSHVSGPSDTLSPEARRVEVVDCVESDICIESDHDVKGVVALADEQPSASLGDIRDSELPRCQWQARRPPRRQRLSRHGTLAQRTRTCVLRGRQDSEDLKAALEEACHQNRKTRTARWTWLAGGVMIFGASGVASLFHSWLV